MAYPKVFVSSTCFDLGEIREQLSKFIKSFGFDPILSENGDVFYHPDLHTHESCVNEIANSQLFILIIGGRFGGEYIADKSKSITNAEYLAAKERKIPIFSFIKENVLNNHHIYSQNKNKEFATQINYPAIEKQQHANDIFNFIDEVRKAPTNNAFCSFNSFQDIENQLKKQWAGMFYEFLKAREVKAQIDVTNHLISGISTTAYKLEELIKSLYIASNQEKAEKEISNIETYSLVEQFFDEVLSPSWMTEEFCPIDLAKFNPKAISEISPANHSWHSYLVATGLFKTEFIEITPGNSDNSNFEEHITSCGNSHQSWQLIHSIHDKEKELLFANGVKISSSEQREKALKKFSKKHSM